MINEIPLRGGETIHRIALQVDVLKHMCTVPLRAAVLSIILSIPLDACLEYVELFSHPLA